jgi:hypothetical protein
MHVCGGVKNDMMPCFWSCAAAEYHDISIPAAWIYSPTSVTQGSQHIVVSIDFLLRNLQYHFQKKSETNVQQHGV